MFAQGEGSSFQVKHVEPRPHDTRGFIQGFNPHGSQSQLGMAGNPLSDSMQMNAAELTSENIIEDIQNANDHEEGLNLKIKLDNSNKLSNYIKSHLRQPTETSQILSHNNNSSIERPSSNMKSSLIKKETSMVTRSIQQNEKYKKKINESSRPASSTSHKSNKSTKKQP